jgi:hypothetical protein
MSDQDAVIDTLSAIMETLKTIDDAVEVSSAIQQVPFEYVTAKTWHGVQEHEATIQEMLALLRNCVSESAKLAGNDAVLSHIEAVITAQ